MSELKNLIKESVIVDSIYDIESEMMNIKEEIVLRMISEGVEDPGILKCIFMAGGPGSGKSFTAMDIFGIDKKLVSSFSSTGLKQVNSDRAFETLLKRNGIDPKDLARIEREDKELWDKITKDPGSMRTQAKDITRKQKSFYEAGRLGMIIDGTGHVYNKIQKNKKHAESLGYDTYMVFVNTSLEVALQRNKERARRLPKDILVQSWKDVQKNLGAFQSLFGSSFVIVDNSKFLKPKEAQAKFGKLTKKYINKFIKKPIRNVIGKMWVKHNLILKGKK